MRIVHHLLLAGCFIGGVACGGSSGSTNNPSPDASTTPDAGSMDTGTQPGSDVPVTTDASSTPLAFTGTCATPINLNTAGTALAGHVTTIRGSNATASMGQASGLPQPTCAMGNAGYQSVFSYTMATTAALEVNTALAGTPTTIDTIAYVLQTCSATGMELACNDDVSPGMDVRSTAFTTGTIPAGTTVFIVLAGYTPQPSGSGNTADGMVTIEVSELMPNAVGAACTASNPTCVAGAHCTEATLGSGTATCVNDGTAMNSLCRTTAPYCNTGLQCSTAMPTATNGGLCQTPVADGAACDTNTHFVCVTGDSCVPADLQNGGAGMCVHDGTNNGFCNLSMPYCNTGLACSQSMPTADANGVCQTPIAHGAACSATHFVCVMGDTCIADPSDGGMATTGHCITDGTSGGACLTGNTCNTGLTCSMDTGLCM